MQQTQPVIKSNTNQCGSGLVGIVLLILALGFLISGGLHLMRNYNVINADQTSMNSSRDIKAALDDFIARNNRLPCPAVISAPINTAAFGIEDCSIPSTAGSGGEPVVIGTIPVRTLNITDKQIVDGYGKRYIYAVTLKHTDAVNDVHNELGAITIKDHNGNTVSETDGEVVYVFISLGKDDRGAYDLNGKEILSCVDTTNAGENCDGDAEFFSSTEKSFDNKGNTFTHNFTFSANAPSHRWSTDAWEPCHDACFAGTQSRVVECRDGMNATVDDAECSHANKPQGNRVCALGPCDWQVGSWGGCS